MANPCPPSADSASVIDSCPLNLKEWNQRALQKNCSIYQQTCFKPLEYHCLLNPYANESLEVCAPNTWLAEDFCPSYNIKQQRILEQFDCTSLISDCPRRQYNSRSILDYKGCLKELHGLTTSAPKFTPNYTSATSQDTPAGDNFLWPVAISIILVIVILITLSLIYYCRRKGLACFKGSQKKEIEDLQTKNSDGDVNNHSTPEVPLLSELNGQETADIERSKNTDYTGRLSSSTIYNEDGGPCLVNTKEKEIRIILLGKPGSGKSATGNSILGSNAFESMFSGRSVNRVCSLKTSVRFDKKVVIVDTPGMFYTTKTSEKTQQEIYKCIGMTYPGPHAFLFVMNIATRFTQEEERSFDLFVRQFGENILRYVFVVFTRKDELDRYQMNLKDFLNCSPPALISLIEKCGGRAIAFDNTLRGVELDTQVKDLLKEIQTNLERNGGECFTGEMYNDLEAEIQNIEREKTKQKEEKRKKEIKEIEEKLYKQNIGEEENTLFNPRGEQENLHKDHEQKAKHQSEGNVANMPQKYTKEIGRARQEYEAKSIREVVRKQLEEANNGFIFNSFRGFFSSLHHDS